MGKSVKTGDKRAKRAVKYLVAAFVFLLAFYAIPYIYTSNAQSCTSCHSMKPYYDSWKKSSHATAANNCFHCHVKQGTLNLFIYRISFYREIYASMVGADLKPIGASLPGVASCQRKGCHSLNRVTSESGDIKINHKLHVLKANISCTTCHPGAAHPRVGSIGDLIPKRKLCFKCHAERRNECSFCHNKRFAFSSQFSH
ncbi:MAG: NapC/NirT family cytochrome c [Firmicutes bacterium]|nr:NapC/NirT family cytochrome c [Bacillota bacterium]